MKKILSIFAAMLCAGAVFATPVEPGAGTLKTAISAADADAVIELATGVFTEESAIGLSKNLTIKAADGAVPVIKAVGFGVQGGATVTFEGIKFDASIAEDHLIYANDATAGNKLICEGCEFYDYTPTSSLIHVGGSDKLDACTINNCYIHNIHKSFIFNENTSNAFDLTVSNSTIANVTTASSYYAGVIDSRAASGTVLINKCTFYNVQVINTDYAAVGQMKAPGAIVSNSIFVMPTAVDGVRAIRDVSAANNCLTYNYIKDSNRGIHSDVTKNNCIFGQDPLFADAANGDYTLAEESPAVDAGTDGKTIGDPRWWPVIVYPEVDFSTPYVCAPAKAKLSGRVSFKEDSLLWNNNSAAAENGVAKWKIHATKGCYLSATINNASNNTGGHCWQVAILDADGNPVGDPVAEPENSWSHKDDVLAGTLIIPAAGDYIIKLSNSTAWSPAKLMGITLTDVTPQTIYLNLNSSAEWAGYTTKFAAYYFDATTNGWSDMMTAVPEEDNIYTTTIPAGYTSVIFVRFKAEATTPRWDEYGGEWYVWSQTVNLEIPEGKDQFTVNGGNSGKDCTGSWSVYGVPYVPAHANGYYLVGRFDGVDAWDAADERFMVVNNGADHEEYMINVTLKAGDALKVIKSENDNYTWYPAGETPNFNITNDYAGEKTVYFRPDGLGGDGIGWHYGYIYIQPNGGTAIDNAEVNGKAVKSIENGMLIIIKNGVKYNAQGAVVK